MPKSGKNRVAASIISAGLMLLGSGLAYSQTYPAKPVRIVTPGSGGGADIAARLIAPALTRSLGQQVVVDNRASGVIPGDVVSKAQPDGYTLLLTSSSHWLAQFMQDSTPYDAVRDFAPITIVVTAPTLLLVHPSVPANSVRALIALAKARPGELNYASIATGSPTHLAAELFKSMAGVNIVRIPYKASGAALTDLIAGQAQLMFPVVSAGIPHVKSGRLKALAITSPKPSRLAPDLPTVASAGLPGYQLQGTFGMFAPAGTPAPIIARLNREVAAVLGTADIRERFFNTGVETVGSPAAELAAAMRAEMAALGKLIRDAGIRAD